MRRLYEFSMYLDVHDPESLLKAARERADEEGYGNEELEQDLHNEDGSIDISACLTILLDPGSLPGCDILNSVAEGRGD